MVIGMQYRTRDGDVIDAICHRFYGSSEMTPAVYEANQGLSKHGAVLPGGIVIELPEKQTLNQNIQQNISLFD